jgi:hypothetical protein
MAIKSGDFLEFGVVMMDDGWMDLHNPFWKSKTFLMRAVDFRGFRRTCYL